jgi:transposase InsO family protein
MTCRYRFICAHADLYKVKRLCRVLGVDRSGYYTWLSGAEARAARAAADADLAEQIRDAHAASRGTYRVRRIHAEIAARHGEAGTGPVNRKRIERVMREARIAGRHRRRRVVTTVPDPAAAHIPDLVKRDFTASRPDEKWCGDITYVPIGESGFVYFATVIDLFSGRLVGWSIAEHMRAELVQGALAAAVAGRGGNVDGVIFHTDRGSQYTSFLVAEYCRDQGIRRSMGRRGVCWDNAAAEASSAPSSSRPSMSCRPGGSPTSPRPAARSSGGSPGTTIADATPAPTTSHRSATRTGTTAPRTAQIIVLH